MNEDLSVYKLIKWGEACFKSKNIKNAFNESASIMKYALKKSLEEIIISYNDKPAPNKIKFFRRLVGRRSGFEPYAYIVNKKEFYSIDFFVNRSVLIPRPDTECLVDEALKEAKKLESGLKRKIRILDLGTGSGAIAISIAKNSDNVIIYAADNSVRSLNAARKNIIANGVGEKVIPVYFNMLKPDASAQKPEYYSKNLDIGDFDNFDIIVSNPPYIETAELKTLDAGVRFYEPFRALDGGMDGLRFYKKIFAQAAIRAKKRKSLILEIDYRKKNDIYSMYKEKFKKKDIKFKRMTFLNDINNKERAVKIIYG